MKIYVVLEQTGGYCGTEPYSAVYQAFRAKDAAQAYIEAQHASRRYDLWSGEMFEVEFSEES